MTKAAAGSTPGTSGKQQPGQLVLGVVELSDSFSNIWDTLAEETGVRLCRVDDPAQLPSECSVVILAAGGTELLGIDSIAAVNCSDADLFVVGVNVSHRFALEAVRRGAADYFVMPGEYDLLRRSLSTSLGSAREKFEESLSEGPGFRGMLGESAAIIELHDRARRVAGHDNITVLIQGETGTGKELLARALHDLGPRKDNPFVAVNCAAIPPALLESELFGHERGAFTDAHRDKVGLFEEANKGTLFLDEVGHLPLALQAKILRVLEDQTIRRVGATRTNVVDVRVISATHVDLYRAVADGEFREDLYFRLNVVSLNIPPLRDRDGDIELLTDAFVKTLAERYAVPIPRITSQARTALRFHPWPGNVRELHHAIERAVLLSPPGTLDVGEFGLNPRSPSKAGTSALPFPATLNAIMQAAAAETVELCRGNKSEAARRLGISRARLLRLIDTNDQNEGVL